MAGAHPDGHPFQGEQPFLDDHFDVFDWYPYFQSCLRYFLEHAQYNGPVQALAAFINIQLPFQRAQNSQFWLASHASPAAAAYPPPAPPPPPTTTTLQPYIRRLVATGFDFPAVLHGFFGDDWELGVGPLHEQERRNFLFAAKSGSWLEVKRAYDVGAGTMESGGGGSGDETVPFLRPLRNVSEEEIVAAEAGWSEWLAMQDWMLGPRSFEMRSEAGPSSGTRGGAAVRVKREEEA